MRSYRASSAPDVPYTWLFTGPPNLCHHLSSLPPVRQLQQPRQGFALHPCCLPAFLFLPHANLKPTSIFYLSFVFIPFRHIIFPSHICIINRSIFVETRKLPFPRSAFPKLVVASAAQPPPPPPLAIRSTAKRNSPAASISWLPNYSKSICALCTVHLLAFSRPLDPPTWPNSSLPPRLRHFALQSRGCSKFDVCFATKNYNCQ